MINAIYNLGKLYLDHEKDNPDLEQEVLLGKVNIANAIVVEFLKKDEEYIYNNVYQEDYQPENKILYLFRSAKTANAINPSPSFIVTDKYDSIFKNKFENWFENHKNDNTLYEKLYNAFSNNKETIKKDVKNILDNIVTSKNENNLLSIVIKEDDSTIYHLNEINEFKETFNETINKYYSEKSKKQIKGFAPCKFCGEEKPVNGLVLATHGMTFSTTDKWGNIPDFNEINQWKKTPICEDCALKIGAGKYLLDKYLNFKEFGLNYYLIPNFLLNPEESFDEFYTDLILLDDKNNSNQAVKVEKSLEYIIQDLDDLVELKFLFYKMNSSAFNILSYVESGIPSYIRNLQGTQRKILQQSYFKQKNLKKLFGKKHEGDFLKLINDDGYGKKYPCSDNNWYVRLIRDFYYNMKDAPYNYLEKIHRILNNDNMDYTDLLSHINSRLQESWRNNFLFKKYLLKGIMLIQLLNELKLINGGESMTNINFDEMESPSKKGTFLLGVLAGRISNEQRNSNISMSVDEKLWGFDLDYKKLQKIYPMLLRKVTDYGLLNPEYKFNKAYSVLLENISENLSVASMDWDLNKEEVSFYFALGYGNPYYTNSKNTDDEEVEE